MRELMQVIDQWLAAGEKIALATVIRTWGSSPRGVGAKMALTPGGKITGSVSGGCVEGAVFETGVEVLSSGQPQLLHFGVADETAWKVGLACGGQIDVFVQPLNESIYSLAQEEIRSARPFCISTVIRGPSDWIGSEILVTKEGQAIGKFIPGIGGVVLETSRNSIAEGKSQVFQTQDTNREPLEIFIDIIEPQPLLVIVGGVHIAIALTSIARTLGYRTVLIDPRRAFGNAERFPDVDRLIQAWPEDAFRQIEINENTAISILTHDPKIDDPALTIAIHSPAFYIGVLGSHTTQTKRRKRLLQEGVKEELLSRVHGPIGLPLGGSTPEEVALAIMAEIVAVRHTANTSTTQPEGKITAGSR